jgi:chemotaxis protein MotA
MDIASLAGLALALAALLVAELMEGAKLGALISPSAFLLVMGGTLGATIMSFNLKDVLAMPKIIAMAFIDRTTDPLGVIDTLVSFADRARREGLLVLQEVVTDKTDPFMARGLNFVIDGADPELVRGVMETELAFEEKRCHTGASLLETAGGYAPTMGIVGTVMGLVKVLGNLEDSSKLGPAIAVAFLATFYGIGFANIMWLPLAAKVKRRSADIILVREIVLEGVLSIQAGENPRLLREKLLAFLSPASRAAEKAATDKDRQAASADAVDAAPDEPAGAKAGRKAA